MAEARPYQACLYVGANPPVIDGVRTVDLTPAGASVDDAIAALAGTDLTPADLRSRVLFLADDTPQNLRPALLMYATLLGFAKRRLDVAFTVDGEALVMADVDASVRRMPPGQRPDEHVETIQVGGEERTDLIHVPAPASLSPAGAPLVRHARRVRFVPPETLAVALPLFVALSALRARGVNDRLPLLCEGTEPAEDDQDGKVGLNLEAARRGGEDLRRSLRSDTRDALAPPLEENPYARLCAADAIPVIDTLERLGAKRVVLDLPARPGSPEHEAGVTVPTEVWHCPRPDRHTNGDANPSARVHVKGESALFQCFRCDPERVGSLRLVMDVKQMTGSEAADWLLA